MHCAFPRHRSVWALEGANHTLSHWGNNFVFDAPHFNKRIVRFVMARHGGAFPVGRWKPQSCAHKLVVPAPDTERVCVQSHMKKYICN